MLDIMIDGSREDRDFMPNAYEIITLQNRTSMGFNMPKLNLYSENESRVRF